MAILIDGSTPAVAVQATGTTATVVSGSFTPPVGSVLLIRYSANTLDPDDPGNPTITDNLGAHLSYTSWDIGKRPDSPLAEGQVATWTASILVSAAMTITVTNGAASPNRHASLLVTVITGAEQSNPVGTHGKSSSLSAASIAQAVAGTRAGSRSFIVTSDWTDVGAQTAGTATTVEGSADVAANFVYGFFRAASNSGVPGANSTLNVTIPGTSTSLRWAWIEILPLQDSGTPFRIHPLLLQQLVAWKLAQFRTAEIAAGGSTVTGDAALTGAGALSALATQSSSATLTGAGALSVAAAVIVPGAATITGAGTLTANVTQGGSAAPSGAGALSAAAIQSAGASPAGAGALTALARQQAGASPAGAGAVAGLVTQQAGTTLTGAGAVSAQSGGAAGTAAPTGAGVLTAGVTQIATVTIAGVGALSAAVVEPGTAALTGAGALTAGAAQSATSSPTGAGAFTALAVQRVTSSPTGVGALTAGALVLVPGAATLSGAGALSALATQRATATLAGAGVLTAVSGGLAAGTATLSGAGALSAFASVASPRIPLGVRLNEILNALVNFTARLGLFDRVQTHEPKSAPRNGLHAALWLQAMAPAIGGSGLASTTLRIAWYLRIYQNFLSDPPDMIDPKVMQAMAGVMEALTADFDLDIDGVRCVDLLGQFGVPMAAEAGYVPMDGGKIYRCMTLTIPVILDDAFVQAM